MKKIILIHTNEEVALGDTIAVSLTKDLTDSTIKKEIEFTLDNLTLPIAVDLGIVKIEENSDILEKDNQPENIEYILTDHEQMIDYLLELNTKLEKKIDKINKSYDSILNKLNDIQKILTHKKQTAA